MERKPPIFFFEIASDPFIWLSYWQMLQQGKVFFSFPLPPRFGLFRGLGWQPIKFWRFICKRCCGDWAQTIISRVHGHKLTSRLSALRRQDMNFRFMTGFLLVAQKFPQVCVGRTQSIKYEYLERLNISPDGLNSLRISPRVSIRGFFLGWGQSYLSTWCFSIVKYFFSFERSNFTVSNRVCIRSSFTDRGFDNGKRRYCSFTESTYKFFAFSFAGEAKLSSVKSWSNLATRDFVSFARSLSNGSFSLA